MVVVAQLVRALDCGSRGRRFETGLPPKTGKNAQIRWVFFFTVDQRMNEDSVFLLQTGLELEKH